MLKQTLSVVICAHNEERYIKDQLEAILAQDRAPEEIVVVDDASTDSTAEILHEYAARVPGFKVVNVHENLGTHRAFNFGLEHATQRYVYACSANDIVLPGAFKLAMGMLDQYPGAALFSGEIVHFMPDGQRVWARLGFADQPVFITPDQFWPMLGATRWLGGGATVARRDLLRGIGGFAQDLGWMADQWVWQVLALRHGFCYAPAPMALMRVHEGRVSDGIYNRERNAGVWRALLDRLESPEYADIRGRLIASEFLTTAGSGALIRELFQRYDAALGRPTPPIVDSVGVDVLGLDGLSPKRAAVLAFASELISCPDLGSAFAANFCAQDDVTLVVLAGEANPSHLEAQLAVAVPALAEDSGPDVMIVTQPNAEAELVSRCSAALTQAALPAAFASLPAVNPQQLGLLRQRLLPLRLAA